MASQGKPFALLASNSDIVHLACDQMEAFGLKIMVVQESDWIERGPHQSHHLMERLAEEGHQIRVIDYEIGWRKGNPKGLISKRKVFEKVHKVRENGHVTVIRPSRVNLQGIEYVSLLFTHRREIQRQLDDFKPDVVIGFGILNASIALSLAHKRSIPFVYYIIDELHRLIPEMWFRSLGKSIEQSNMKRSDAVLSINEGLREYSIAMGADPQRTKVIRAGVDLDRFKGEGRDQVRRDLGIEGEDIVLFFMGWLYDFSGLDKVALELSESKSPRIKLLVLGKGELWDRIQEIKEERGLGDRIIMVGWKPYSEVPKYIAASDVCLLPAQNNEIMRNIVPIKMYEYLASSKPVIATALPGLIKEFGEDHGVIYVPEGGRVVALIEDLVEKGQLSEQCRKARQQVIDCDWKDITRSFKVTLMEGLTYPSTPLM